MQSKKLEQLLEKYGLVLTDNPDFDYDESSFEKAVSSFIDEVVRAALENKG